MGLADVDHSGVMIDGCGNLTYASTVTHRSYFPTSLWWLRGSLPAVLCVLAGIDSASAHPADQSEMRVRPTPHKLEIRLTFNLLTLTRFTGIDTDGDAKISMEELSAAQPKIATYLNQHIHLQINGKKALLGSGVHFQPIWPNPEETKPMAEPEYAARNMDVTFVQTIEGRRLEDFWLGFEIFEQTGPMQTIRGVYEQDGRIEEVAFSVQEPEYTYDTGYADDPFLKQAEKPKGNEPGMKPDPAEEAMPTAPRAMASNTPASAAAISATGMGPVPTSEDDSGASPAGQPGVSLAAPLQLKPQSGLSDERQWMIRAVIVIVLLVAGRFLQLKGRVRPKFERRRTFTKK